MYLFNIIKEPVRLASGRSAALQNCTFSNIKSGMVRVADIFYSQNETSSADQTVTISGNTFNGDVTTVNYPIVVGANAKINENVVNYNKEYCPFIKNSIITDNGVNIQPEDPKLDIVHLSNGTTTFPEGCISYSFIGNDQAPFVNNIYYHDSLLDLVQATILQIPSTAYSNRVAGLAHFANAASGDYHLQSAAGRWNGSEWVNDDVTSNCINAGDPTSLFANELTPNGERINIGRYGNTLEASKSATTNPSYLQYIILPDGKVGQYDDYTVTPESGSVSPVASGESYSFTVTVNGYHYKTSNYAVKVNGIELTAVENVYTIDNITGNRTITVEGIALIQSPTFIAQPQDLTVALGAPAFFSVEVETEGYEPTYNWRVSDDGGVSWENAGDTDAQLDIAETNLTQSGWKYICYVSYPYGSSWVPVASDVATLTVTDSGKESAVRRIAAASRQNCRMYRMSIGKHIPASWCSHLP